MIFKIKEVKKMARRHSKEGGNQLEQKSNIHRTMEGTDGELHPAMDGQSQGLPSELSEKARAHDVRKEIDE